MYVVHTMYPGFWLKSYQKLYRYSISVISKIELNFYVLVFWAIWEYYAGKYLNRYRIILIVKFSRLK